VVPGAIGGQSGPSFGSEIRTRSSAANLLVLLGLGQRAGAANRGLPCPPELQPRFSKISRIVRAHQDANRVEPVELSFDQGHHRHAVDDEVLDVAVNLGIDHLDAHEANAVEPGFSDGCAREVSELDPSVEVRAGLVEWPLHTDDRRDRVCH